MSEATKPRRSRWRLIFFLLGLAFFAVLLVQLNPAVLWDYLKRVRFGFLAILGVSLAWYAAYALAWEIFLRRLSNRVHWWDVFKIKVAGEAVNSITPLSWGGGDPVRILLLKKHIPFAEGTASVVVDRTLNNLAIALFMLIGVLLAFAVMDLPAYLKGAMLLLVAAVVGGALFFYFRSHQGLVQFFVDLLKKLRLKKSFSESTLAHVEEIDRNIREFYSINKAGFAAAFGLHFFGRLCGVAEIYLAARFLDFPLSWTDSYLLASLTVIINLLFVFVPGTVGVMEGAFAGVFALIKVDPALGTSLQIIRRLRMVFWTALGFFFMSRMKEKLS